MLRAAARSVIVSRCVRGIDGRGLHNTNLEALRTRAARRGPRRDRLPRRRVQRPRLRLRAARRHRRRLPQRGDRRGLGAGQGQPRPLHAQGRRRATPSGTSRRTSATPRPSTARRSPSTASRRCTACRSSRSPTTSWRWRAGSCWRAARPPRAERQATRIRTRPPGGPAAGAGRLRPARRRSRRSAAPIATVGSPRARPSHSRASSLQPALLARADRRERPQLRAGSPRHDPRLDLAEDEAARVGRDDVELPVPGAEVGVEDLQPARLQVSAREALAGRLRVLGGDRFRACRRRYGAPRDTLRLELRLSESATSSARSSHRTP